MNNFKVLNDLFREAYEGDFIEMFIDFDELDYNFEKMTASRNNKQYNLLIKENQIFMLIIKENLLPEHIQNSYKKWLISKTLKEKLK